MCREVYFAGICYFLQSFDYTASGEFFEAGGRS
jgi:hypothetical protein